MARGEISGRIAGLALSPFTGLISAARHSRMFHPSGILCSASAEPIAGASSAAREVAARLAGPVLVRWSSAWWKTGEWMDVLGCALRFSEAPLTAEPKPSDQDLLLATIQRPWTMPFAPFTTRDHDFFANTYYGVSPFDVPPLGRIEWRLAPEGAPSLARGSRRDRIAYRVANGSAKWTLEWALYPGPLTRPVAAQFEPLLRIEVERFVELDQRRLRYDPFRSGRGVEPVGFVHNLRRAAYWTSQRSRPSGGA
ncbi:MAG TPA: hypothetical protein VMG12_14760 [Polyangiaceae bacterium]|nr:hypothetical protein [Polyangiaceae bacterium]